jgi:hypothetical protein
MGFWGDFSKAFGGAAGGMGGGMGGPAKDAGGALGGPAVPAAPVGGPMGGGGMLKPPVGGVVAGGLAGTPFGPKSSIAKGEGVPGAGAPAITGVPMQGQGMYRSMGVRNPSLDWTKPFGGTTPPGGDYNMSTPGSTFGQPGSPTAATTIAHPLTMENWRRKQQGLKPLNYKDWTAPGGGGYEAHMQHQRELDERVRGIGLNSRLSKRLQRSLSSPRGFGRR